MDAKIRVFLLLITAVITVCLFITFRSRSNCDSNTFADAFEVSIRKSVKNTEKCLEFPKNFKFGTATSSYQIEGAWNVDGKGPNIWDHFIHNNSNVIDDGLNADDAALSYYYYKEDIKALKELNTEFYRFSISWSRILPNGSLTSYNQLGVDYYHKVIDEVLANGIEPIVTIYHWELPQTLEEIGGWRSPLIVEYFADYARLLFREYGDKIQKWITVNEINVYCNLGYGDGIFAPGVRLSGIADYECTHNSIMAHARAYHIYKSEFSYQKGRLGLGLQTNYHFPKDPNNVSHVEASYRGMQFKFGISAHPLVYGDYPQVVRNTDGVTSRLPQFTKSQLEYVKNTYDFIGLNYYTSTIVQPAEPDHFKNPSLRRDIGITEKFDPKWTPSAEFWLMNAPDGLYRLLMWIKNNYNNVEIFIAENGWSDNGDLNDDQRIDYLRSHYEQMHRAIQDGCNITGHTVWSLIDNFEWTSGYNGKFGLYHIDFNHPNRTRTAKKSAKFVEELFKNRKLCL